MADIPVRVILDAIDNASGTIKGVAGTFDDFASKARTAGTGMAALGGITALVTKGLITQAGAFEQNTIAFETMLGSAERATTLLNEIKEFAKKTPFNLEELVEGSKKLLAYNVSAEELIPTLDSLGNIAAGVGREKFPQLVLAFGQVKAATKLTGAELRQFSEAGVPLLQTLADQAGVSAAVMTDKISKGAVSFEMVEKALKAATSEGGKFHDLMQKQSESTLGKVSNLEDGVQQMQKSIGKGLLPQVNDLVDSLIPLTEQFGKWAEENPVLIEGIIKLGLALGILGTTLIVIGMVVPSLVAGFGMMRAVLTGLWGVMVAGGQVITGVATLLGGPLTIAIVLLTALIVGFTLIWKNNWFDIQTVVQLAGTNISASITAVTNSFIWLGNYILTLPTVFNQFVESLKVGVYVFFTETLPYAIGYLAGRLVKFVTEDIPNFINSVITWFGLLPGRIKAFLTSVKDAVISYFNQSKDSAIATTTTLVNKVSEWIGTLPGAISDWLSQLPGIVSGWFNSAKDQAVNIAKGMYEGVKVWFEKVVNFFKEIYDWASKAVSKATEAATAGFSAGKRQFGGPVNAMQPVMVGEAGPEMFTPSTSGRITPAHESGKSGGGATIQFIINSELIINSPTERRSIAEALYKDLVVLARSQDLTVAQMLGG